MLVFELFSVAKRSVNPSKRTTAGSRTSSAATAPAAGAGRVAAASPTDVARLRKHALHGGLRPLRVAGAMKVAEGLTTLEEVLRATPAWQ